MSNAIKYNPIRIHVMLPDGLTFQPKAPARLNISASSSTSQPLILSPDNLNLLQHPSFRLHLFNHGNHEHWVLCDLSNRLS